MQIAGVGAVVTGGASGLGAATARALAERGAVVFALDLPESIDALTEPTDGVTYLGVDVTDGDGVRAALEQVGPAPLRIVVNCAGIAPTSRVVGRSGAHDLAMFTRVVMVNLVGTFTVMTLAAERIAMTESLEFGARGVVINTASIAAFDGQVGQVAYSASKGGVVGMNLPAARDLAQYGIRVNTIAPGIVETPMLATVDEEFRARLAQGVPFPQRLARPDEYAQLVIALVEHDYLNGEVIRMDGALRMAPR